MTQPMGSFRKALKQYDPVAMDPRDPKLAGEVIARWIEHSDCELVWTKIEPLLPEEMAEPFGLIHGVIEARIDAVAIDRVVKELPALERKVQGRAIKRLRQRDYREAMGEVALLDTILGQRKRTLSRKSKTAALTNFITRTSMQMIHLCGQPLDDVVRILTEIAFDTEVSTETITKLRQHRNIQRQK